MPKDTRRLLRAWALLMGLSAALALFADIRHNAPLSTLGVAAAALVVIAKCRIVLADYLDLRRSSDALRGFLAATATILVIVAVSFVARSLAA